MPDVVNRMVKLAQCRPHPRNYNQHSTAQLEDLRSSLRRFGQVRSIVVQAAADGGYLLVAGHGIVAAASLELYTELRADVIPATWSEMQVLAYLAADNELGRQSNPDIAQLAAVVATMCRRRRMRSWRVWRRAVRRGCRSC